LKSPHFCLQSSQSFGVHDRPAGVAGFGRLALIRISFLTILGRRIEPRASKTRFIELLCGSLSLAKLLAEKLKLAKLKRTLGPWTRKFGVQFKGAARRKIKPVIPGFRDPHVLLSARCMCVNLDAGDPLIEARSSPLNI